ncbi:hypothetical protein GCM10009755_29910 [Brevibacterium samyangense]|uniref:Uncharacterized protein n=1 Tax=Brevibacterium samyangense TaxID=366888 RepID=A0ABN2TR18_9MICO
MGVCRTDVCEHVFAPVPVLGDLDGGRAGGGADMAEVHDVDRIRVPDPRLVCEIGTRRERIPWSQRCGSPTDHTLTKLRSSQ